jgi:hypothetical protein
MANDSPNPFDPDSLIESARHKTELSDFGDEGFETPLRVLLASLAEAPLNAIGTMVLRSSIRRSLMQRLRAQDWFTRHPEIADEKIEAPLVVVGMMRSGTTLIQRLLARDPRFYCALGWEIGEPAPRPGTDWNAPDPRIADGDAGTKQMRDFAPELYAIHPTDAREADEEIVFLADAFLSHIPEASCHVPAYRSWLDSQDFTPAYLYLKRMLQLLQWQKRKRGENRERWVLKTPAHLGYLATLFAVFPDAHVIHLHRSPLETIPSGASLNFTLWKMYADEVDPARVGQQWLERMTWAVDRALAFREDDDTLGRTARFSDLAYRDAVSDPIAQLEPIYRAIGMPLRPEARHAMGSWLDAQARNKRPAHHYSASQFGLSDDVIRNAFGRYMARFIDPSATLS